MDSYDAIVVGGGPAGSSAARRLVSGGLRVAVLDAATFPRVKLCAGWVSPPVWDALGIAPREYPRGLWEFRRLHVSFSGKSYTLRGHGYFIRRYEFDDFLLQRSGAQVVQGHRVRTVEPDGDGWVLDGTLRARFLVGAAGTHCPVARALFPERRGPVVGAQEKEFPCDAALVASARVGEDGESEILLHEDLGGYSWKVPKTGWFNIGSGTFEANEVRDAWTKARAHFRVPEQARAELDGAKGHSYYVFRPAHLERAQRGSALLAGDALGLAQPATAEGILPAVVSGQLAAEAILAGDPARYRSALAAHPILRGYARLHRALACAGWLGRRLAFVGKRRLAGALAAGVLSALDAR